MDRQKIFNKVYKHLLTQKVRSYDKDNDICLYRQKKGDKYLKCAVGCLIPSNRYNPKFEKNDITSLFQKFPNIQTVLDVQTNSDKDFLLGLQEIHDSDAVETWNHKLAEFAFEHELTLPMI